jgi:IS4 transposase
MLDDSILERFVETTPLTVMARMALERALDPSWVDALFEDQRERQYTRELLFSTVVELTSAVALGLQPSLHAAAQASRSLSVSLPALYGKLQRTEPALMGALVRGTFEHLAPVAQELLPKQKAWVSGLRVRIVDGNHLPASEKRLGVLRDFRGAALPGHSLVVYDPELDLVSDLVACEDAHAQERAVMQELLERIGPGELWLADRLFCTSAILSGIASRGAKFLIREHARNPNPTELGRLKKIGRTDTGQVYSQEVECTDPQGKRLRMRRIMLQLDQPTEDGETTIRMLTNTSTRQLSACKAARMYRNRWRIEGMFQRLEAALHSELRSLGSPRAALLAFTVSVAAYNVLALVQRAVAVVHPPEETGFELSFYYVANELRSHYPGMMIALPPEAWRRAAIASFSQLTRRLKELARCVQPRTLRKHPREPKPKPRPGYAPASTARRHVATSRVLAQGGVTSTC